MNRASSMLLAACLVFGAACASATTTINERWLDSARPRAPLGKTLVVGLLYDPQVASALEREWARQLRRRGVDATAIDALGPDVRPPGREAVQALALQHGFETVLVSKRLDLKHVGREDESSQVAVIENKLYDARTGRPFWSVQTDTFIGGSSAAEVKRPGSELVRDFVETLIAELVKAKLL